MRFYILPICLLSFLMLSSQAVALGISPSRTIIDYEPGLEKTYQFYVLNTQNVPLSLEVYVSGALSDYVKTSTKSLQLSADESMKGFTVTIKLPPELENPGIHDTRVGVVEALPGFESRGTGVAARVGVESQLWVRVPYPGIYADIELETEDVAVGENADFTITVHNRGTDPITASGTVEVKDSERMVASLNAGSAFINPKESEALKASWSTEGFSPGIYTAVATVKYDGQAKQASRDFRVGALSVDIFELYRQTAIPNTIVKMPLEVRSLWNEPIKGIYAELEILDGENVIAKSKSETFDLEPWESMNVTLYADTNGFDFGEYGARVTLHYAGRTASKLFRNRLVLAQPSYEIYIYAAIAIAIAAAAAVLVARKRKKKHRKLF